MTERDPRVAAALERLQPRLDAGGDWERVVRDARPPRRLLAYLAAAAAVVAVVGAVPALAGKGWWFLGIESAPKPATPVVRVAAVEIRGVRWVLTAYASRGRNGICVELTPGGGSAPGAEGCVGRDVPQQHAVGYVSSADVVFAPARLQVATVDALLAGGRRISVRTLTAPPRLHAPVRFYVVRLPHGARVRTLIARDRSGAVLERRPVP